MKQYVNKWLHGLGAAGITGVATSALSALGINVAGEAIQVASLDIRQCFFIALGGGVVGVLAYLKQSPLPKNSNL